MKMLHLLGGTVLGLLGIPGVIWCVINFEMLRDILFEGTPVYFQNGGSTFQIAGGWVGLLAVAVPIAVSGQEFGFFWLRSKPKIRKVTQHSLEGGAREE